MNWVKSLMITGVFGIGMTLVIWLVSEIADDSGALISTVLLAVFALMWFWVHQILNDSELGNQTHK